VWSSERVTRRRATGVSVRVTATRSGLDMGICARIECCTNCMQAATDGLGEAAFDVLIFVYM